MQLYFLVEVKINYKCRIVDFTCPADNKICDKERDNYEKLPWEAKHLC